MIISKTFWGTTPDGEKIYRYRITNKSGAYVELSNLGAAITALAVPDRDGELSDVVLGYENPLSYIGDGPCCGKVPGRFANRIAKGKFSLEGKEYSLEINNGPNHLHGGSEGFHNKVWESRTKGKSVEFKYISADGESGYPGDLMVVAHYEWSEDNVLRLTFTAKCSATTILNLTNHAYFNLNGEGNGSVLDHELTLNASEFLPTDETLIPLGESIPVAGTPMDFVNTNKIGSRIKEDYAALVYGKGYDNCYVIDGYQPGQLQHAASLYSPQSGRMLEVLTTQPGVQVYTGNWLEGCPAGKNGHTYHDYDGVAIECQHFPDSPNKEEYPGVDLRKGETFGEAIIFSFSTK